MVNVFRQEDGSYLIPMELPGRKSPEEIQARASMLEVARLSGYKVDWAQWGFRKFEAVLVPGSEEDFKTYMKEESNKQKHTVRDGRCPVESEFGGTKRCPERIPNPHYGEPGEPKTIAVSCDNCPYGHSDKIGGTVSLSQSGENDEDDDGFEDEIPTGIAPDADLYELYCEKVMDFVRERYPNAEGMMELLLQDEEKTKIAKELGVSRNTPNNQLKAMKDDLLKFIDSILIYD